MPPNTEANIAPLLGLFLVGKVCNISPMSCQNSVGCDVVIFYLSFVKSNVWHNSQAMSQKFSNIVAIAIQITTVGIKINCHEF